MLANNVSLTDSAFALRPKLQSPRAAETRGCFHVSQRGSDEARDKRVSLHGVAPGTGATARGDYPFGIKSRAICLVQRNPFGGGAPIPWGSK